MADQGILEEIKRLKTIADLGLFYCTTEYDRDRYEELQEISFRLLHKVSGHSLEDLRAAFPLITEYPTAKVDLRGLLISEDKKVLLVREDGDGRWSLPGGWADIGYSPSEGIIKEFREETGLHVVPQRLLAIFDKKMHPHPSHRFYMYKLVFLCKTLSSTIQKGFDVLDVQYFDIDQLPELSEDRILKSQIVLAYRKALAEDAAPYFD